MAEIEDKREEKKEDNGMHSFLLRIEKHVWQRFVETLPASISANEKLGRLVLDYLLEYEKVMGNARDGKADKDRQKE